MAVWDRQEQESEESWALFKAYRDSNPPRRLYNTCVPGDTRRPPQVLLDLSRNGGWEERVVAYDRHLDGIKQEENEKLLRQTAQERQAKHLWLVQDLRDLAYDQAMKRLLEAQSSELPTLSVSDIIKLADTAVKLERLSHGESTENLGTPKNFRSLSDEELAAWRRLEAKVRGDVE